MFEIALFLSLIGRDGAHEANDHERSLAAGRTATTGNATPALQRGPRDIAAPPGRTVYVCPMHPEVVSETAGACPKCNMKLEPKPAASIREHEGHGRHEETP
jgi:hypothetical protein